MKHAFKPGEKVTYDMDALCKANPDLEPFMITSKANRKTIDFAKSDAVRALNQAILKFHFGIKHWDLPLENLIPPIPGRAHYLYQLRELIGADPAHILDIGCGANIVYPLVGNALFDWSFVGTDIDDEAISIADSIVQANKLEKLISVRKQENTNAIFEGIILPKDNFTATICNPPFYKSMEMAMEKNRDKNIGLGKNTTKRNFNGKAHELTFPGGEFQFINNMIWESEKYAQQVGWFTCLISKAVHARKLEEIVKKKPIKEHRIIEMTQGQKQTRILAWKY